MYYNNNFDNKFIHAYYSLAKSYLFSLTDDEILKTLIVSREEILTPKTDFFYFATEFMKIACRDEEEINLTFIDPVYIPNVDGLKKYIEILISKCEILIPDWKTKLEKALEYHSKKYYEEDSPEISDYEYDAMFDRLKKLEEQYPEYASPVSMTHRVGGAVAERFEKVRHNVSLGSLTDVFSPEEVTAFCSKVKGQFSDVEFVTEAKIDGLSVALEYENGLLVRGSTRGDGDVGEDVTVTVELPEDATGQVLIDIDGVGYYGTIVNGKAKVVIPELPSGKYRNLSIFGDLLF